MPQELCVIRPFTAGDLASLAHLITELGYPTSIAEMQDRMDRISAHSDYETFVATVDGKMIGMAGATQNFSYEQNGKYVRLLALVIDGAYRNKGFGKILLKAVENWAMEKGCSKVLLNCGSREERARAHLFYQQCGYEIKSSGYVKKL